MRCALIPDLLRGAPPPPQLSLRMESTCGRLVEQQNGCLAAWLPGCQTYSYLTVRSPLHLLLPRSRTHRFYIAHSVLLGGSLCCQSAGRSARLAACLVARPAAGTHRTRAGRPASGRPSATRGRARPASARFTCRTRKHSGSFLGVVSTFPRMFLVFRAIRKLVVEDVWVVVSSQLARCKNSRSENPRVKKLWGLPLSWGDLTLQSKNRLGRTPESPALST